MGHGVIKYAYYQSGLSLLGGPFGKRAVRHLLSTAKCPARSHINSRIQAGSSFLYTYTLNIPFNSMPFDSIRFGSARQFM